MNSVNLAICFAPSLLWPSSGLDVIKNEVPPLIMFFIEHCPDIFGAELPVLYRQLDVPSSPIAENMEFSVNVPATQQFIPTKVDDGEYSQTSRKHKHTDSIGSSMSEEESTAETEDDNIASLLRARKSGLTLSDSQISQISQLEDYEPSVSKTRQVRKRGVIEASGKHIHTETRVGMLASPAARPSPKRVKKTRVPERSSSLHGPNDMVYNRAKYVRARPSNEALLRRKSIAVQEPVMPRKSDFVNGFEAIPPSPNSSYSSSSHSCSPKMMRRIHHSCDYYSGYGRHDDSAPHSKSSKPRRIPRYSHSFTSNDTEKPRYMPSSSSFYDKLLPLDAEETNVGRPRTDHHKYLIGSESETHQPRPIITSTQATSFTTNSTQSIASSSISNQTRPSNISLSPGGSGSSLNRASSPDLMIQSDVERGEFLKVAISERFKLNGSSSGTSSGDYTQASGIAPNSSYTNERVIISMAPSRDEFASPGGSESGQDSLERIQKKLQERKRLGSDNSESPFSKSSSYKGFLSTQQKKDSLMSLAEESSIDDRPECDIHLSSLSRQRSGGMQDSDPNKLYASNGYNSDTESAPSRTLSRPGKILEVISPTKTTMPSRYFMKPQTEAAGRKTLSSQQSSSYTQQEQQQKSRLPQLQSSHSSNPTQQKSSITSELPTTLEKDRDLYDTGETAPVPNIAEPLVSRTVESSKTGGTKRRPKSGDRVEKLTESYKAREEASEVNANIEDAKVKLGLIPHQRQRSRSTSEKEAMKILHRMEMEDEESEIEVSTSSQSSQRDEEWTVKRNEWLSSAPTSAERKQAWENYSSKSSFSRTESYKSRSLRSDSITNDKLVPTGASSSKLSCTPETKRKCSTMPDELSVKTVKVRVYEIPEPQRIRRINLRTYY